jgi:hypothetical protein
VLDALQASWLAHAIGESQMATASLSALHLVGFTIVMGSAFASNLRMMGALLPDVHAIEVVRPALRTLVVGLLVSAVTGALLFVPRASAAAANTTFRVKLSLLVIAALVHFVVMRVEAARDGAAGTLRQRATGAVGFALWAGVAVAGCVFILLE